ncbi:MAG: trypsin-like peptidase domain-containing protein, partial [Acidimicrobiia bacterium]|nr:trypsin-like peptidase domain-containing protein [Acidimicrobiia bacterium]
APPKSAKWISRLVLVLLVAGSSAGITWLAVSDPAEPIVSTQPSGNEGNVVDVSTPSYIAGEEPIADAAEKILPSVVQIQTSDGVGSGVVFGDGLIMTAAHVVSGETTVLVRLEDGEVVEGTVLGGTSEADIAVVQIARTDVPQAQLALDYEPRVGQMAIAVGSPWDLTSTVTAGIVSAVNQPLGCNGSGSCRSMLQTDAAINPGNSGGPLVDRDGRVLGINVSIFSLSGANDGVGFAVPIDVAYDIAQAVIAGDNIEFGFLGVRGTDAESGRAGALITEVTPGQAAEEAGFMIDDLVVSIDGVRVQGISDLASQVRTHRPGESVEFVVVRDGEELTLVAVLQVLQSDVG